MTTPAIHIAKPSSARKVVLDAFIPVPRGTPAVALPPLSWPTKDPRDVLDYEFNISPALIGSEGDTIVTLDVTISPDNSGDLALVSALADGNTAVLWLTAGQSGTIYTVMLLISTASEHTLQRSVLLPVLSLSVPQFPANAIDTGGNAVLTDQNGNPILS